MSAAAIRQALLVELALHHVLALTPQKRLAHLTQLLDLIADSGSGVRQLACARVTRSGRTSRWIRSPT